MQGECKKVLLVEDEILQREALRRYLCRQGFNVELASDGQEALCIFRKSPGKFGVVITDMRMPMMNGLELCRELANADPVPVILCSATLPDEIDQSMFAGIFQKPIVNLSTLGGLVGKYCFA